MPDFTKLSGDELLAKLGGESTPQSHLAWQAITDRRMKELAPKLLNLVSDKSQPAAKRIGALWALEGLRQVDATTLNPLLSDTNRNVRREAIRVFSEAELAPAAVIAAIDPLADDADPEVRAEVIRTAGKVEQASRLSGAGETPALRLIELLIRMANEPLAGPTAKSTHSGKTIKIGEAYEREFERYLVRLFLERQPDFVAAVLDSDAAKTLPIENRLLATLALEPKASAARVAQILPQLIRPPGQEEILRLAQFPDDPGVADALKRILQHPATHTATLEALLKVRTKLDTEKLTPILETTARGLLFKDDAATELGLRLASSFKLSGLEDEIERTLADGKLSVPVIVASLRALREIGARHVETLVTFTRHNDTAIRDGAIAALAASRNEHGPQLLIGLWPELNAAQRRTTLASLSGSKTGAGALVKAVRAGPLAKDDLDSATFDKLQAVLGDDKNFIALMHEMASFFHPALRLDGNDDAWVESDITLDGPFTIETWIKLDLGIDNNDGILGAPGVLDMNFHDTRFRVWVGGETHDAIIAKKKMVPDVWTHLAVARDAEGKFRIYLNGELDTAESKVVDGVPRLEPRPYR
ncbi:MAG: hypothetical protein DME26_04295 [Verrucomicrobia bacterium]|nr:MAG: hypothetical protein DME26_04295 [Verrucomicrobiota bacterium]